jgi:hypothetical protein
VWIVGAAMKALTEIFEQGVREHPELSVGRYLTLPMIAILFRLLFPYFQNHHSVV